MRHIEGSAVPAPLRVLLADDHPLVAAGIGAAVLTRAAGFQIVATARDGHEVLPLIARTAPDVVLLDINMPHLDGLACLTRIKARYPELPVVIFSAATAPLAREAALAAGAADFVTKSVELRDLAPAVLRAVARRRAGTRVSRRADSQAEALTERETLVLAAVADGLSNRQIAAALQISIATVKFHLANVYRKLGVSNRTAAAQRAMSLPGIRRPPTVDGDVVDDLRRRAGGFVQRPDPGRERTRTPAVPCDAARLGPPDRRT